MDYRFFWIIAVFSVVIIAVMILCTRAFLRSIQMVELYYPSRKKIRIEYVTYEAHIWKDGRAPLKTRFSKNENGIEFEKNITRIWFRVPNRPGVVYGYVRGIIHLDPGKNSFRVMVCVDGHDDELGYQCQVVEDY